MTEDGKYLIIFILTLALIFTVIICFINLYENGFGDGYIYAIMSEQCGGEE